MVALARQFVEARYRRGRIRTQQLQAQNGTLQ
jgi:hypothetical protein